jgi:hypothetical protein
MAPIVQAIQDFEAKIRYLKGNFHSIRWRGFWRIAGIAPPDSPRPVWFDVGAHENGRRRIDGLSYLHEPGVKMNNPGIQNVP